jgi:hypothetical protein
VFFWCYFVTPSTHAWYFDSADTALAARKNRKLLQCGF